MAEGFENDVKSIFFTFWLKFLERIILISSFFQPSEKMFCFNEIHRVSLLIKVTKLKSLLQAQKLRFFSLLHSKSSQMSQVSLNSVHTLYQFVFTPNFVNFQKNDTVCAQKIDVLGEDTKIWINPSETFIEVLLAIRFSALHIFALLIFFCCFLGSKISHIVLLWVKILRFMKRFWRMVTKCFAFPGFWDCNIQVFNLNLKHRDWF